MSEEKKAQQEEKGSQENQVQPFDVATCSLDDFEKEVIHGKQFLVRDEWLTAGDDENHPVFGRINKMINDRASGKVPSESGSEGGQSSGEVESKKEGDQDKGAGGDAGGAEGKQNTETEVDFVELEKVKIPKELLGTYIKNRSTDEAVIEALKGKVEADKFISELRGRHDGLASTTISLRQQLAEAQRKLKEAESRPAAPAGGQPASQNAQSEDEEIDFDSDAALFDSEVQEKFKGQMEKAKKLIASYKERLSKPQEHQAASATDKGGEKKADVPPEVAEQNKALADLSRETELLEISDLQRHVPEMRTQRPFKAIDLDVHNFQLKVGSVAGGGDYAAAVRTYYSNTPQGEQLRANCEAQGVKPPAEIDTWAKIITLRTERNKNIESYRKNQSTILGRELNPYEVGVLPNNTYLDMYQRSSTPDLNKLKLQSRIEGHKEAERAAAAAGQHVPEPPPSEGNPVHTSAAMMSEKEINDLITKPIEKMSTDEAKMVLEMCKSIDAPIPKTLIEKAKG